MSILSLLSSDSVNITEREVLGRLLEEVGVSDVEGALACLTNQKCIEEYKEGIREAQSKGKTLHHTGALTCNVHPCVTITRDYWGTLL